MTRVTYYLRARYYDPTIGRFLTRDPLPGSARDPSFPEGLNAYPYVQNNPVNRVDSTGLFMESLPLNWIGFALTLIAAAIILTAFFGPWTPLVALPFLIGNLTLTAGSGDLLGTGANILGAFGGTLSGAQLAAVANFGGALLLLNVAYNAGACAQDIIPGDA